MGSTSLSTRWEELEYTQLLSLQEKHAPNKSLNNLIKSCVLIVARRPSLLNEFVFNEEVFEQKIIEMLQEKSLYDNTLEKKMDQLSRDVLKIQLLVEHLLQRENISPEEVKQIKSEDRLTMEAIFDGK